MLYAPPQEITTEVFAHLPEQLRMKGRPRTGASHRTSCRFISGSFSSCTTRDAAAKPYSALSLRLW